VGGRGAAPVCGGVSGGHSERRDGPRERRAWTRALARRDWPVRSMQPQPASEDHARWGGHCQRRGGSAVMGWGRWER